MPQETLTTRETSITIDTLSEQFTDVLSSNPAAKNSGDRHFKSGMNVIVENETVVTTPTYRLVNTIVSRDKSGNGSLVERAQVLQVKLNQCPTTTPETGGSHVMHVSYDETTIGIQKMYTKSIEYVDGHRSRTKRVELVTPEQQTELLENFEAAMQEARGL